MSVAIVARSETSFTVQVEIPYASSMLDSEEVIQDRLHQAGVVATQEALRQCASDGSPVVIGSVKLTRKGQLPKEYPTPYGVATVARHVSQSSQGGKTSCPLDRDARLGVSSTPRFAPLIAHQYAEFGSGRVILDLEENPGRKVARSFVQNVADAVASVALAQEASWDYALPKREQPVQSIALGLDGTCRLRGEDGWRETRVGTISFYDRAGERQHTISRAATPESGRATFRERMEREIERVEAADPRAPYIGIADGAGGNGNFRDWHAEAQVVDFGHAVEDLGQAAAVISRGQPETRQHGRDENCQTLKHEPGGAVVVRKRLKTLVKVRPWAKADEDVPRAITSFRNPSGAGPMDYASRVGVNEPVGSGVTEAACQVLVKQRLCGSGMKWKEPGAAAVLSVRCLTSTPGRWDQFWSKIDRNGFPVAA